MPAGIGAKPSWLSCIEECKGRCHGECFFVRVESLDIVGCPDEIILRAKERTKCARSGATASVLIES